MQRARFAASAFFGLSAALCSTLYFSVPACADDFPFQPTVCAVTGTVQSVSSVGDRLTVAGSDDHRYVVDAYGADIILRGDRGLGETSDLSRGMRVEVTGTLLGRNLVEAERLRVLPDSAPVPVAAPPPAPLPPPAAPVPAGPSVSLDGLIREVDAVHNRVTVLGNDDKRYALDVHDTDIILRGTERAGQAADLSRGMRVHLVGALLPSGLVEADRLRVLPPADAPPLAPAAPAAPPAVEDLSVYTGILIDARALPRISRSPAPAIYGPAPDQFLLYPDRAHVPTPDEVQEESIVRYYHAPADAQSGIAGARPMILTGQAVIGPAEDAVQLTPEDAARFLALDKRLHFTRTWKVGFLMPANQ